MNLIHELRKKLPQIEERIDYVFQNKDLFILALTHRSFYNEHRQLTSEHNERLEFLGDSVLGLVIADFLYHRLPSHPEGELSQLRSRLVDATSCAKYLQKLRLQEFLLLGRGEKMSAGGDKISILADAFEAIIGAIYLDGGMAIVRKFLFFHFDAEIEETLGTPSRNYKAELQDLSQKKYQKAPVYKVIQESGPDHAKTFRVVVVVGDREEGQGIGASKKEAEQCAALDALTKIRERGS